VRLGDLATAQGFRALRFDALGSTNDEAMSRARAGDSGALWIMADVQTAGRGRQGRLWVSPHGNLHASLLLIDVCKPQVAAQLGFVAGVALVDALRIAAPAAPVALKWPNDVLCSGAKLAGVLVEGGVVAGGAFACVIGFGVDCAASPSDLPYPAVDLLSVGAVCAPCDLLLALADSVCRVLDVWRGGVGFPAVREAWLSRAAGLGQTLEARTHKEVMRGVFETIDEDGRLVLVTTQGRVKVEAADVFPALTGESSPRQDDA
jgi:BirA family biotin operon repressor/biotin-[acetyl-CoA-carboxylase] ligase